MHTIYSSLTLCITTLHRVHCAFASVPGISDAEFIPSDYSSFRDMELLNVVENNDEEIVYLRRRGDGDCVSDCPTYSGWTEDEKFPRSGNEQAYSELDTGADAKSLLKRNPKRGLVCNGITVEDATWDGMQLSSPRWPRPIHLEKTYHMVYDIGDPSEPLEPEWYKLSRRDKRWQTDLDGRTSKRLYDAEHVLEWALLLEFLEKDKDRTDGKDSRCLLLYKYFGRDMPKDNIKVQKAKDYTKSIKNGEHFDYEETEYQVSKYQSAFQDIKNPRAIDWIGMQWPGRSGVNARPPTPWEYELVLLNRDFNNKKADIWGQNSIFQTPLFQNDGKTLRKTKDNSLSLEALYTNRYYTDDTSHDWPENKGKCKAVYRFNTMMSLVMYHNDPYIQELMRAQVKRVGAAFEHLESKVLPKLEPWEDKDKQVHDYKAVGLKDAWIEFMKDVHKSRLEALNKALEDKIIIFKGSSGVITRLKRWDFAGVFTRADKGKTEVKPPNCGTEKDNKNMAKRVELLVAAYEKLDKVDVELKLD